MKEQIIWSGKQTNNNLILEIMTVELTKDGLLKIEAEIELEAYALKKWVEENMELVENPKLNKNIVVCYGLENQPPYRGR
jgi:uncharacterized metal-binding protein